MKEFTMSDLNTNNLNTKDFNGSEFDGRKLSKNSQEFKTMIYNLMNGLWEDELYPVEESKLVRNEFLGGEMSQWSEDLYEAKDRIYDKLGVNDDPDIEKMLDRFEKITEQLCYKMYDYGALFMDKTGTTN